MPNGRWILNGFLLRTSAPTIPTKFLWYIYYINKSRYQNFQQFFLLDTILFKQQGLLKR